MKSHDNKFSKRLLMMSTFTALFAALICVGCLISIPTPGGVPIAVQNMFCMLAGSILGGIHGAGAVGLFILLGGIGLPVFAGAHGGIAVLIGPTGGYIWGYFIGALVEGLILGTPHTFEKKFNLLMWVKIALATLLAYAIVYAPGIPWFMHVMKGKGNPVTFQKALEWTFIPFIPGDLLKWFITIPLTAILRPVAARFIYGTPKEEEEALIQALNQE